MTLAQTAVGKTVKIQSVQVDEEFSKRCFALGLRPGANVTVIRKAFLNGPLHVRVGTTELAIRQNQAKLIKVL